MRLSFVYAVCLSLLACGPSLSEPTSPPSVPEATDNEVVIDQAAPRTEATEPTPETEVAAPTAPRHRVRFDLAEHLERAEVREGENLFVDLGTPAGDKYTLGGWSMSARAHELDETRAILGRGTKLKLQLPFTGTDATLTLRLKALHSSRLVLYVNGRDLATIEAPRDEFGIVRVNIAADRLRDGENELMIRSRGSRSVPGTAGGRSGVAVDWMRIGPRGDEGIAPVGRLAMIDRGVSALRVPDGWSLGFASVVPEGGRLRAVIAGEGELTVKAVRDGEETLTVATSRAGRLDVPLDALAGDLTRLDLHANGSLVLLRPVIVTQDHREVPEFTRPRNVLLYLIDTLRADKLSPYNQQTRVETPGLARFLEAASTMASARSQENWTKPSVATLLSSLMPWQHTATQSDSVVPRSVELLPEILMERGFYTGSFIANGYVSDRFGFRQGWDTYRNYIREGRRTRAEFVAADVLEWLDARPAESPFFLYVHTIDPHVPYRPPSSILARYAPANYEGPVSFRRDPAFLENVKLGRISLGARDRQYLEALYDGEITYHDTHFAAILDALERREIADDTMVVVTSDHGEEFWDHGSVGHGHSVYDELLHVPLFVRLPGAQTLSRVDSSVGLVDVLPTILDALGQEIPDHAAGTSFLPQLLGQDDGAPRVAVSGFMENWRTCVVGDLKLTQRPRNRSKVFDLAADPGEETDLAESRPLALRYLRGLMGIRLGATVRERQRSRRPSARPAAATHESESVEIDDEMREQLRQLGYVE